MDLVVLQRIALELHDVLAGGFVNKIHQPFPREIVLRVRIRGGGERKLMLSADPAMGRIHLTALRIPNPPAPPRFCAFLRAHFQGSRIVEVRSAEDDRVVHLVGVRGSGAEATERALILELLGRDSNIILVDRSTNLIMECLHRLPPKETGTRAVIPGNTYELPPRRPGATIAPMTEAAIREAIPGISLSADGKQRLTSEATGPKATRYPSMNLAADALYGPRLESGMLESFRRGVAAPLRRRIRSLERRLEKVKADAARLGNLVHLGNDAELLKANLPRVRKGMESIQVDDWSTGGFREIELDPALTPVANMQRMFAKAAKGKRGRQRVPERLAETEDEKRAAEDLLYYVESASSVLELETIAQDSSFAPTTRRSPLRTHEPKHSQPEPRPFRTFRAPSGIAVLVGKSAAGNEALLRKHARKSDLWFHVKDYPGAHVLLPQRAPLTAADEDKRFAAALAVSFSKVAGKGPVEVIVADVTDLGRPKGGFPGQVTVRRYTTVMSAGLSESEIEEYGA